MQNNPNLKCISLSSTEFCNAAYLFLNNPTAIHRSISVAVNIRKYVIHCDSSEYLTSKFSKIANEIISDDVSTLELLLMSKKIKFIRINDKELSNINNKTVLLFRQFLPKRYRANAFHCLLLMNLPNKVISQFCLSNDQEELKQKFSYIISLKENLEVHPIIETERMINWCNYFLKPKFSKWAKTFSIDKSESNLESHSLIDAEKFALLYRDLKEKYGEKLMKAWTESTDPKKFIYEDIGIASYLILLWENLNEKINYFVDLGCGNGLLVYILNSEGYSGCGIDVKRRKIWDIYPKTTRLVEKTIDPSTFHLNAEKETNNQVDWIIGNHSDELSAWIPVIAARMSYKTNYFLLPCCAYELSGSKFLRRDTKLSVYQDFLKYLQEISSTQCQFFTYTDRLKIPSTKRTALIGYKRKYSSDEMPKNILQLQDFVSTKINGIKLRSNEPQAVRNCTQIDKNITETISKKIFHMLLTENRKDANEWDAGRSLNFCELVKILNSEELKTLKSECGGLKTLLKNHHEIFSINGNQVSLKRPKIKSNLDGKSITIKKRKCFFYFNHPNGCPLSHNDCTFLHDEDLSSSKYIKNVSVKVESSLENV